MTKINIPFNKWSRERLRQGCKRATSRTKKYGDVGATFIVDNQEYVILYIEERKMKDIIEQDYIIEGADSPEELREVLKSIFRSKLDEERELYFHRFTEKDDI